MPPVAAAAQSAARIGRRYLRMRGSVLHAPRAVVAEPSRIGEDLAQLFRRRQHRPVSPSWYEQAPGVRALAGGAGADGLARRAPLLASQISLGCFPVSIPGKSPTRHARRRGDAGCQSGTVTLSFGTGP